MSHGTTTEAKARAQPAGSEAVSQAEMVRDEPAVATRPARVRASLLAGRPGRALQALLNALRDSTPYGEI